MTAHELDCEEALRRLALNEERFVASILALYRNTGVDADTKTDDDALRRMVAQLGNRTRNLLDLAALIALGSGEASIDCAIERALQAGATVEDVIGVLISIAPVVGSTRVVDGAPLVAAAVGYDMWADLEGFGGPPAGDREAPEVVASEAPVARQPHR